MKKYLVLYSGKESGVEFSRLHDFVQSKLKNNILKQEIYEKFEFLNIDKRRVDKYLNNNKNIECVYVCYCEPNINKYHSSLEKNFSNIKFYYSWRVGSLYESIESLINNICKQYKIFIIKDSEVCEINYQTYLNRYYKFEIFKTYEQARRSLILTIKDNIQQLNSHKAKIENDIKAEQNKLKSLLQCKNIINTVI